MTGLTYYESPLERSGLAWLTACPVRPRWLLLYLPRAPKGDPEPPLSVRQPLALTDFYRIARTGQTWEVQLLEDTLTLTASPHDWETPLVLDRATQCGPLSPELLPCAGIEVYSARHGQPRRAATLATTSKISPTR